MAKRTEKGQALISVVIGISLLLLVLFTTVSITQFSNKAIARQLTYQGQALNAAQAGIVESLSWFRRESAKSNGAIKTFAPKLDLTATPPVNDTEEPATGIVRTFDVSSNARLKGRYEARISTDSKTGVLDVSTIRQKSTAGTVWQLESTGYVYINNDDSKAYNQVPNVILSKQTVRTEIQRLTISLPAVAVVVGSGADSTKYPSINIGSHTKIVGGPGDGLDYVKASSYTNKGTITGNAQAVRPNSTVAYDIQSIFNVTQQELVGMADIRVTSVSELPNPLPNMSLIIISPPTGTAVVFDDKTPLTGSGILVIFGDLTINANSNSYFNGLIYCTGKVSIDQPALINGCLIASNTDSPPESLTLGTSTGADFVEIDYDSSIIDQMNAQMGQYRYTRGLYWVGK